MGLRVSVEYSVIIVPAPHPARTFALARHRILFFMTRIASYMTPQLALGIGCRKDSSTAQISAAIIGALGGRRLADVRTVATITERGNTPGLTTFCQQHALPLHTFSAKEINALPQSWPPSAFVKAQLGVTGVCEPCALLAAAGGALLVAKFILDGVTVAIAAFQDLPNEN